MNKHDSKLDLKKSTILIVDSCACGLAVLKSILPFVENYNVIYFADTEYNPLGLKTKEQLSKIISSWHNITFNNEIKADILILACNTASISSRISPVYPSIDQHLNVINMVDAFEQMLKENAQLIKNKRVGLMATRSTINSRYYQSLIDLYNPKEIIEIIATQCEKAVAHNYFETNKGKKEINCELSDYAKHSLDIIILACTCFGYIKNQIAATTNPSTMFMDPSDFVSKLTKESLNTKTFLPKKPFDVVFLSSGNTLQNRETKSLSKKIFGVEMDFETIKLKREIIS